MANVQLQASHNSPDEDIVAEIADGTLDKEVLILFDEATSRDVVVDALQRLQECVARRPYAAVAE